MQSQGRAFETPEALLAAVGLHAATQRSLRTDLQVRSRVLQRLTHHSSTALAQYRVCSRRAGPAQPTPWLCNGRTATGY